MYYFIIYHLAHYRRKVVRQNIMRSFPEKSLKEIKAIERRFYHNLCDMAVETCKLKRMSVDDVKERVKVTNPEVLADLQKNRKSFFYAFPHSGNWEWFGKMMQILTPQHPMAIYKKVKNADFDRFIYELRTSLPVEMIEDKAALRTLVRRADSSDAVLILADQTSLGLETDYWNRFLNQETCWFTGLERMAKFLDYPIVFVAMKRVRRGHYELTFQTICTAPKESESGFIMEQYSRCIEKFIQGQPDNWLWSHRRWKHHRNQEVVE